MPRICSEVIDSMLAIIPEDEILFIVVLGKAQEDCLHETLEDVSQWQRLDIVVNGFLNRPSLDWEFEVLSILTMKSVEELKVQAESDLLNIGGDPK